MEGDQGGLFFFRRPEISIHSLRMEGDMDDAREYWEDLKFQSTPSAWRETYARLGYGCRKCISIHSLRMEGDPHG